MRTPTSGRPGPGRSAAVARQDDVVVGPAVDQVHLDAVADGGWRRSPRPPRGEAPQRLPAAASSRRAARRRRAAGCPACRPRRAVCHRRGGERPGAAVVQVHHGGATPPRRRAPPVGRREPPRRAWPAGAAALRQVGGCRDLRRRGRRPTGRHRCRRRPAADPDDQGGDHEYGDRDAPRRGATVRRTTSRTAPARPLAAPGRDDRRRVRGRRPGTWWVSSCAVRARAAQLGVRAARHRQSHRLRAAGVPQVERERRRGPAVVRIGSQPAGDDLDQLGRGLGCQLGEVGAAGPRRRRRVSAGVAAFHGATPVSAWKAAAATPKTSDAGPGAPPARRWDRRRPE